MGTPIKTQVLDAILAAVQSVVLIKSVFLNPTTLPTRETAATPCANVWDETESVTPRNRLAMCEFPLQVDVWLVKGTQALSKDMDIIQAELHKVLVLRGTALLKQYSLAIIPDSAASAHKEFYEEQYGSITLRYVVKYAHRWDDPDSLIMS